MNPPRGDSRRRRRAKARSETPATPRKSPSGGRVRPLWRSLWVAVAFLIVAFVAYGPAISAPLDFDDVPSIVQNLSIRRLWPPLIPLTTPPLGLAVSGRPIANYSFAVSYALNRWLGVSQSAFDAATSVGTAATISFHATNIVLHVVAALLLFALIRRTIRFGRIPDGWRESAGRIAAIVALLWLVHPIQTEAVNYVVQRTEVLVSVWYLITLYAALRARSESSAATLNWSILAVVASALGMATKEVMITAPLMVVLFDRAFVFATWREPWRTPARRTLYVALLATTLISIGLIVTGGRSQTAGFHTGMTWYAYAYSQAWAISRYLTLAFWPSRLTYDYGQEPIHGLLGVPGIVLLVGIAIITLFSWRREAWRWLGFLGAWFFLLLAPSSSVVPIRTEIAAERRVYLALAAVIVLVVVIGELAYRRFVAATDSGAPTRRPTTVWGGATIIAVALIATTYARSRMYTDPELLWRDAIAKRPENARAYNGLAVAELRNDPRRLSEADTLARRAVALDSTLLTARLTVAAIAIKQARWRDAEMVLTGTLRFAPTDSATMEKLGAVLVARGEPERAIPYLERLAEWRPSGESLTNLGAAHLSAGQLDSAVAVLERALHVDPTRVDAMSYLGGALIEQGRGGEAIPILADAVQRDPASGFNRGVLSVAYAQVHQADLAKQAADAAVTRSPNDPGVYVFAGRAMQTAGRFHDAETYLARAVQMLPGDPQALTRLGMADAALGNTADAARFINRALTIAPGYELARGALAELNGAGHRRR